MQIGRTTFYFKFCKKQKEDIHRHCWKKCLKVRKPYQLDTTRASEHIAPQSREILQTLVFNDYSRVKAKLMMLNNHRQEVEGIIQQY